MPDHPGSGYVVSSQRMMGVAAVTKEVELQNVVDIIDFIKLIIYHDVKLRLTGVRTGGPSSSLSSSGIRLDT